MGYFFSFGIQAEVRTAIEKMPLGRRAVARDYNYKLNHMDFCQAIGHLLRIVTVAVLMAGLLGNIVLHSVVPVFAAGLVVGMLLLPLGYVFGRELRSTNDSLAPNNDQFELGILWEVADLDAGRQGRLKCYIYGDTPGHLNHFLKG